MTLKHIVSAMALLSASASADVMVMKNGERLLGELQSIRDDSIVWTSDSFSTVTVSKTEVSQLVITREVKVNGHEEPCYMDSFDDGMMQLNCEGSEKLVHLDMLYSLEPWVDPDYKYFSWKGNVRLFGELNWGNRTDKDWTLDADTTIIDDNRQHRARVHYKQDESTDPIVPTDVKAQFTYDFDWFYNEHWYLNSNAEYLRDDSNAIVSKYTVGIGAGYRFWDDDTGHLFIENGPAYIIETKDDTGTDVTTNTVGWVYRLDWVAPMPVWPWENRPDFYHRHKVELTNNEVFRQQIETDTGITFPVLGEINADINIEADYDSEPAIGRENLDYKVSIGLSYSW